MKALVMLVLLASPLAGAMLEIQPSRPVSVFGGRRSMIELLCRNHTDTNINLPLEFQLFQASSATVAPWSTPQRWRTLRLSPRQTTVEALDLEPPTVREECHFILRIGHSDGVFSTIKFQVFPDTILSAWTNLVVSAAVFQIDPELRVALSKAGIAQIEIGKEAFPGSSPRLTIYGPESPRDWWSRAVSDAKSGAGVIWVCSDENENHRTAPSYYSARMGKGVIVTVQQSLLSHMLSDPVSQLRFARILRLAMGKESLNPAESEL